jgi:NAD dependent epimerase/dehydratase family enzyme
MVQKYRLTIKLIVSLALCYPQFGQAEEFTGKQFLAWEERNQDAFITESVSMMIILANDSENGKAWSRCAHEWFFESRPERLAFIKENIARFEDFQPQLTIYASARKACGRF